MRADYDDGVYWQTAMAIGAGKQPYTEVFDAQPPLFPWLISLPFRTESTLALDSEVIARVFMTLFAVLLCASAAGVASFLGGPQAGMIAALGTAILPIVQDYSYQFGADLPAAALTGAALWCAVRAASSTSSGLMWTATGGIVTLALFVKLIAVVVLPAIAILIAAIALQGPSWRARVVRGLKVSLWTFAGVAGTVPLLILLLRPPQLAWQQIVQFHVQAANEVQQGILSAVSGAGAWYWPFLLLAGCAAILNLRHSPKDRPTTIAVSVFAATGSFFVFLHRPIFEHHMLVFVMPGSVLLAVAANALLTRVNRRESLLPNLTILMASFVCATQWAIPNVGQPIQETKVEACLRTLPRDYEIVSDDQELLARAGLKTPPWLVDTSNVRIKSGYLSDDEIATATEHADGVLLSP
ncbi:MAG TPA: glycosyltransferase family 39 protein, partial [Burkholderiaceae bacterium]|nr:glycosyltransferase family 39 protein [Burkholderiaceae bacterium]